MANIEHADLTDPELHEPKGASSATANKVYVANGSGSGTWKKITTSELDTSSIIGSNEVFLTAVIDDVSTASSVLISIPFSCSFTSAQVTLGGTITVANSSLSFTRNDAASFGTALTITYSGSVEGSVFTFTPSINTSIASGGYIKITTDGASTTTQPLYITIKLTRT